MRRTHEAAVKAGEGLPPETRLRAHIRVFLERQLGLGRDAFVHQILVRETVDPTPALDLVVEQGLASRIRSLSELVAELLNCTVTDERVGRGVINIQALCFAYQPNPFATRLQAHMPTLGKLTFEADEIDALTGQISSFAPPD